MSALSRYEFNQAEFAELCQVTVQGLRLWHQDGFPEPDKPTPNSAYYDLRVHLPWVIANKWKKTANLREQKLKAEVEILEMQKGTMEGSLVSVAEVSEQWSRECSTMRSRLLALPTNLAVRISGSGMTQDRIASLIKAQINEALDCLSGDPSAANEELPGPKEIPKVRMPRQKRKKA